MATVEKTKLVGEKRIVLSGISWEMYGRLRDNGENWHVRTAYYNLRHQGIAHRGHYSAVHRCAPNAQLY
jgi:hypothetical protein